MQGGNAHLDVLSAALKEGAFEALLNEVQWEVMFHAGGEVPRRVACQGDCIALDASRTIVPLYRHPADESPSVLQFSPTVDAIRRETEARFDVHLNHCLIQHYRQGRDYISEHSDKTLDIAHDTPIINISLGATRQMILRPKRDSSDAPRTKVRVELPHSSAFVLDWAANKAMTHSIRQDRRLDSEKRPDELSHDGHRISLTFRSIATFQVQPAGLVFGQGGVHKTLEAIPNDYNPNDTHDDWERLLAAFSIENNSSRFNWHDIYGAGFDVCSGRPTT